MGQSETPTASHSGAARRRVAVVAVAAVGLAAASYWALHEPRPSAAEHAGFLRDFCADCHNAAERAGELDFARLDLHDLAAERATWENVIRKLRVGMMPPEDAARPPETLRNAVVASLEASLDELAAERPEPGPAMVRRLNRSEYANAVRDLLDLKVDAAALLPPDDAAHGFDNNAEALVTSPLLIEQYLSAAGQIAALAVGDPDTGVVAQTFRFRQDASQHIPVDGMPVGTVGGGMVDVVLPLDGEYRLDVRYFKSNLGAMKGLELEREVEIAVDGARVHAARIGGPEDFNALMQNITAGADAVEARSSTSSRLTAGAHRIGVGFVYAGATQSSVRLEPYLRSSHDILDVTGHPHIETLTITGPYDATGPGDTESRRRIFSCTPEQVTSEPQAAELACARAILERLARLAYRGRESADDLTTLMRFFAEGRTRNGFERGIQTAIERLLASPKFIFRIERDPDTRAADAAQAGGDPERAADAEQASGDPERPVGAVRVERAASLVHAVSDLDLATRLSFFLWSSIPDDTLLDVAARGTLSDPEILDEQVRRMLSDPKAHALVENFAGQWLQLRNLRSMVPNSVGFPDFDDNLRQALLRETELFFESVVREDRPITALMTAQDTFLNERLARHYGIRGVYGAHYRRVTLDDPARFGLLGKGSVLMVSSHTDRTSPVVRGKWVLENLLGTPPPPPPPDVPAIEATADGAAPTTFRERLVAHRSDSACSACHALMDPIGFALEHFDAVGAWREYEFGSASPPIDARGRLMDGTEITGPVELREALMADPEIFVSTVVEKLMVYALGRGLVATDMPAVRRIVREAQAADYRFSAIVLGIVHSVPFRMRAMH